MTNAGDREPDLSPLPGAQPPEGLPASSTSQPFAWPPRRLTGDDAEDALRPARWRTAGPEAEELDDRLREAGEETGGSWIDQVERHWLGRTTETFLHRARARGWSPDEPGMYCPRCGSRVGLYELPVEGETGEQPDRVGGCGSCERRRLPWTRVVRLGDYAGLLRRGVHELKFRRWRPVGEELGALLGAALAAELERAGVSRGASCLVPVPTPWWRRIARGVDHTQVFARAASRVCGSPVVRGLRRKWRPSQLAVAPSERRLNVRGSFRSGGGLPAGVRVVIVIDDVRTTGATMIEACRALLRGWRRGKGEGAGGATAGGGGEEGGLFELWTAPVAVARTRRRPLAWSEGWGAG